MPDYSKGKIYTIRCRTDDKLIYVGSTIQPLHKRFSGHKIDSKKTERYPNHKLYNKITNWDDWYIELYENYPCNSKEELCQQEGEIIRLIGTLNRCIAGRKQREYQKENADKIKEYQKEYQKEYKEDNKEKIKVYKKQYCIENADKIREQKKEYYLKKKQEK
jgi:hypothetical protein